MTDEDVRNAQAIASVALLKALIDTLHTEGILTNEQVVATYQHASNSVRSTEETAGQTPATMLALQVLAIPPRNRSPNH